VHHFQGGHFDHGGALEFAVVGHQPDLARLRHDGAGHHDFAHVVVAQRAVGVDAADADQADVDLELTDEVQSYFSHDAEVFGAQGAAGHHDFALWVGRQNTGHVQVIGHHPQVAVLQKFSGHCFYGGANVHEQAGPVRNGGGHLPGNVLLGAGLEALAFGVGDVAGGRVHGPHAAMKALQLGRLGQALDVAPGGLQGDPELFGQFFGLDAALLFDGLQDGELSGV
jgi:hypothetical protein